MDEDIPASAKNAAKVAFISSIIIGAIIISGLLWYIIKLWYFIEPANIPIDTDKQALSPSPSTTALSPISSTLTPSISNNENVQTYTSPRLNVSFRYSSVAGPETPNNVNEVLVQETGERIYVYPRTSTPEYGQFVEVLRKASNETLQQAITRVLLAGKDPQKCFIVKGPVHNNSPHITTAEISFPRTNDEGLETLDVKTQYCGKDYAQTNGVRYFLEDKNHPEVFLFISIGQYGIYAEEGIPWQNTIKILN